MPNDYIDNIKTELENQFKPESCIKKEPFIKLGTGQAPVLDYNIPQTACFNTYGHQYVKGPILNVSTHTLKTSSLVADSVLGQGEALDCFNMKAQNAVALLEQLKVIEKIQQLEILNDISEADKRAELYKKVFGECCDTPQTQIIS